MSRTHDLDTVLREMDPATAPATRTAADLGERARADLDTILATMSCAPTAPTSPADRPAQPGTDATP